MGNLPTPAGPRWGNRGKAAPNAFDLTFAGRRPAGRPRGRGGAPAGRARAGRGERPGGAGGPGRGPGWGGGRGVPAAGLWRGPRVGGLLRGRDHVRYGAAGL